MSIEHKYKRLESNPGALVNTDKAGAEAAKIKKAQFAKINNLEEKITKMESTLEQILVLLSKDN